MNRGRESFLLEPGKEGNDMADEEKREGAAPDAWDATQWHVVEKGETLSKISKKYYGDPNLYMKIFEANKDILKNPDLIKIGQKLRIP